MDVPAPETFTPTLPVSVIIPAYQPPTETLARTLAALERQTWPRNLFEVVIVDDGSQPPLERPRSTPLDVNLVRQERRHGFGAARARNTGVRAAAHNILLFLDADMLPETDWIAAHARWHHVVSDALTLGFYAYAAMDGIDAETIRCRPGRLEELFSDRPVDPHWIEAHMRRTDDLTSMADDLFRVVTSGNFGILRHFYELVGGFDESFVRYGLEDTELGYRAYTYGGLLIPLRDTFAWHQGRWRDNRDMKNRSQRIMRSKAANLIAHRDFRRNRPRRVFLRPQYVVTVRAENYPTDCVIATVANVLADRVHDLVVRIETPAPDDSEGLAWLRDEFGPDPRVRIGPSRSALGEFPLSPFHIVLPAAVLVKYPVRCLARRLGSATTAAATLPDGARVSITRTWALHRARRTGGGSSPADFGEARTIPAEALKPKGAVPADYFTGWAARRGTLLDWMRDIHSPGEAWRLLMGLASAARWRVAIRR